MCQGLEFRRKMNCIFLWEMGLGEAGHDSREDTLMPQRPLISGSLRKKLTEGHGEDLWPLIKISSETTFHCDLEDPGDKWEVAASNGVTCWLNQRRQGLSNMLS